MSEIQNGKKRFCTNCGTQAAGDEKFCMNCGTELPPVEPAGQASAGTEQPKAVPPVQTAAAPAGPSQPGKKKSPLKTIGIVAGVVIVLAVGATALSGTGDETETSAETEMTASAESSAEQAAEAGETAGNQQIDMEAYDLYYALEENGVADYVLNAKATNFLKEHGDLFPADSAETIQAAGVVDESLEARQIMKSPDRYGDQLMMLPELQVVQISETEMDTNQYLTDINAIDLNGQQYYIFYNGVLDDVFENDWISAYGLPLGTATFANTEGGETWTIPVAGSYVGKLGEMGETEGSVAPAFQADPDMLAYLFPSNYEEECSWYIDTGYYMIPYMDSGEPVVLFAVANSTTEADVTYYVDVTATESTENGGLKAIGDMYTNTDDNLWNGTVEITWDSMESVDFPTVTMIDGTELTDVSMTGSYSYYGLVGDGSTAQTTGTSFQPEWLYGSYEMHDGYLDASAEVGFNSGDGTDYLSLNGVTSDGSSAGQFYGIITVNDGRNGQAVDEAGNVIAFYYNGLDSLVITDGTGGTLGGVTFPGFSGTYQKTADLSMNAS